MAGDVRGQMSERFEPEVVVLYCGRSLGDGEIPSEETREGTGFRARLVMMPCTSKVEVGHLLRLIEHGADGVVVVGCPERQCQFLVGSSRAQNRVNQARTLLGEAGMGRERLVMVRRQGATLEEIMALAEERAGAVGPLGRNPMKAPA